MRKNRKLRIGIIGCGTIAAVRHLPEYASREDVEIAAVYNRTRSRSEAIQRIYGGVVCDSIEELVALDIDAVSVCTANAEHARDVIAALRAGKHVLCEKPMEVTMEKCIAMTEEAKKAGRLLMIAHNQRFSPAHVRAHEIIAAGGIGNVLSFDTEFSHAGPEYWTRDADTWFFHKEAAGMGVLADLGIHKADLIHYLTGEPVTEIYAQTATLDKRYPYGELIDVEDNAWCVCRLRNGAEGTMRVSWTNYGDMKDTITIYGTEGAILCYDYPEHRVFHEKRDRKTNTLTTEILTEEELISGDGSLNSGVIDEFIDCIRTGRPCRCTGWESLKAMRVVIAALDSAQSGEMIDIPDNKY